MSKTSKEPTEAQIRVTIDLSFGIAEGDGRIENHFNDIRIESPFDDSKTAQILRDALKDTLSK